MPAVSRESSALLVVDLQVKLMPAIDDGMLVLSNVQRLLAAADIDACRTAGFLQALPDRSDIIVSGCEAHVCVLQTVMGLLNTGRRVYVVRDALGSRRSESKETAIR